MFYLVKLHHWKYKDVELQFYTWMELQELLKILVNTEWTVTYIRQMNGNQKGKEYEGQCESS